MTGDGALGAWAALRDVFPEAREQRGWVHKTADVLDSLPKRLQPRAKTLLHEMIEAPTRQPMRSRGSPGGQSTRGTRNCRVIQMLNPIEYAKISDIYEGTQQVNQLIIARRILGYTSEQLR